MAQAITLIENTWIPLPDGRRLAARIWLPEDGNPQPAILEYLPYRKRDGTAPRDETTHRVFAANGYACIRVDIAGTGDSEGQFDDEYSEQELADGEAVIDWIAGQSWCSGKVGMIGISWGGFNGLQLAFRQPPALGAVVSVASTVDRYDDDIHFMGGCLLSDNVNWGAQMFAYLSRPADPELRPDWRADWLNRLETLPFSAADWLEHPTRDAQWRHGSVCEDWSRMTVPVLALTGWADAYVNAPLALVENMPGPAKAFIGPWEHRYPHISKIEQADFHGEVLRWFDHWLKGLPNGAECLPDFRTFLQEHDQPSPNNLPRSGRWVAEQSWPSPNVSMWRLHLGQEGLVERAGEGAAVVSSPAYVGAASGYFCAGMRIDNELPGDQAADDELSACFDMTLPEDLQIIGRAELTLRFQVDKPVAQIVARLCDVAPDGVSCRVSYRPFNLTHVDGHDTPKTLVPGETYEARFALNACAHRFKAGHKLRLALSSSYWPIVWPAPDIPAIKIDFGGSHIDLPVRDVAEEPDPQAPGPARPYPVLAADKLREPSGTSETTVAEDGTITLQTFDDYGEARDPYHGLEVGSSVAMRYTIHPQDPTRASYSATWRFTFRRGDWQVAIDTENLMTCDKESFHLSRSLRATESGAEVFAKDWSRSLPRGFH